MALAMALAKSLVATGAPTFASPQKSNSEPLACTWYCTLYRVPENHVTRTRAVEPWYGYPARAVRRTSVAGTRYRYRVR